MTDIRHYTASAVVLDDSDRVLLVHHNKIGMWLYPGGHIDPNEDPAQAALREVREETGIQAVILGEPMFTHPAVRSHAAPWAIIEMAVTDSKVGAHQHIDLVYVARAAGGDLAAQPAEVAGAQWVTIADISGLATPAELPTLVDAAARWAKARRSSDSFFRADTFADLQAAQGATGRVEPVDLVMDDLSEEERAAYVAATAE